MTDTTRNFTLRQLSTFVCAARAGSFALAADQLDISQPAVSTHISALERRLGKTLFRRRSGKPPTLTAEGNALLRNAENILRASRAMHGETNAAKSKRTRVRLSIGPVLRDVYLKPILPKLYRDHPEIELIIAPVIPRCEVQSILEDGDIDLAVYTMGEAVATWPNLRVVGTVPTVMIAPPGTTALLSSGAASLEDLQLILPSTGKFAEHWLERHLDESSWHSKHEPIYVEFPDVIIQMVEDGFGISVLMEERVASAIAAGRIELLPSNFPAMSRVMVRARSAPAAARIVEDCLAEAFRQTAGTPARSPEGLPAGS